MPNHPFSCILLLVSLASALGTPKRQSPSMQPLLTSSGLVQGHAASWPANTTVVEYLGIPYAQPPLGQLRFAAPEAYTTNSSSVFVADKYSEDCMQYVASIDAKVTTPVLAYGFGMGGGSASQPHTYGEDCLTLNIWTNPTVEQNTSKAVLLWIYGGSFVSGTSDAPFYNGARLAQDEDVIVVSFNYRLNIFGFPEAPGLSDQNVGLLDQRLATEWVRDNIAAFGGDPSRITLFGESAGASSVDFYSYAWTEDPIVNGFIGESGTAFTEAGTINSTGWYNVSQSLGCGGEEAGNQTVACVRQANATDIINAVGAQAAATGGYSTAFGPTYDGKVVFADVKNRSATGNFIQKPYLIGNNDNELGLVLAIGTNFLGGSSATGNLTTDLIITYGNALDFNCPAALTAKNRAAAGVPTWRYRYMGVWNNTALVPGMGAYHTSEIPFVFGTNSLRPNSTADTPQEVQLAQVMMHAWAEFAKDPTTGLSNLNWPLYNPNGTTLVRLGYANQSEPSIGNSTMYDGLCSLSGS